MPHGKPPTVATPIIGLRGAPGERQAWDVPTYKVYLWGAIELLLVYNPWQVSSRIRARALKLFGAKVGEGVILRPRMRVKFPWKLEIGDDSWIGEGVWIHNQDKVQIGHDVVVSQETLITTGSHDHRRDMALITAPVIIEPGCWITSRCIVLGGTSLGASSLAHPLSVIRGNYAPNSVLAGSPAEVIGKRFI